jgi:hypothetical protein
MADDIAVESGRIAMRPSSQHVVWLSLAALLVLPASALAQSEPRCVVLCAPEFKIEPTWSVENLFAPPRIETSGVIERASRETVFEVIFAVDVPTSIPRIGMTFEAAFSPFRDDNDVDLETELNIILFETEQTNGWVSSHFDIVDQFSPAERPGATRSYTHKLDFEWDTAFHVFSRLPEGHWLRNVEAEVSLDYLATGLPKAGDVIGDERFLDNASPWSLSFVMVIPLAPLKP